MILDISNIRDWIRRKLGEPIVCVELDRKQVEDAIEDAFLWWSAYRGWYKTGEVSIAVGTQEYDLSTVDTEIIKPVKVWFTVNTHIDLSNTWNGFLDIEGYPYDHHVSQQVSSGFYSGLMQWLQQRETAARILSVDDDWVFDEQTKMLTVSPVPSVGGKAIFMYQVPFKASYLSLIPPVEAFLVREYSLAEAKETLGRIRGKYTSGLPAAQGNVNLDGDNLLREAREDKDRLLRELMALIPPPRFLVG